MLARASSLALFGTLCGLGTASADAPAGEVAVETFDAVAATARRVDRLDELVWALTASCERGDDVQLRQCRHVRDAQRATYAGATLLVDGEPEALAIGAWDAGKRSAPVTLASCIACAGVTVEGKRWFVVGSGPRVAVAGGLRGATVHDAARTFADEAALAAWRDKAAKVRVQFLVKVPAAPRWSDGGKDGLGLDVVGYRVWTPCDGDVVCASPVSDVVVPDPKACGPVVAQVVTTAQAEPVPERLEPGQITDAMRPVGEAAVRCLQTYGVHGRASLKVSFGADGRIKKTTLAGDFVGTPTGTCIERAAAKVRFPPSQQDTTSIVYPILLR
jgi:hypothetical protein